MLGSFVALKKFKGQTKHSPLTVEEILKRNNTIEKLHYTAGFQRLLLYGNLITFIYQLPLSYTENFCLVLVVDFYKLDMLVCLCYMLLSYSGLS